MTDDRSDKYFSSRMTEDPRRDVLWRTLCAEVFQRYVPQEGVIVDLGAARGEFINNIVAARRIAVDVWAGMPSFVDSEVEAHTGSATDLSFLQGDSVDVVFASNLVEHLPLEDVRVLVAETRRVLRPRGRLILVQPNYRLCAKRYFDDYTHISVWSDIGLRDFLVAEGYDIERIEPRFMPYSVKSRLPVAAPLIRAYLRSPIKPLAGQMLVIARKP